jgi:hypothetical protein
VYADTNSAPYANANCNAHRFGYSNTYDYAQRYTISNSHGYRHAKSYSGSAVTPDASASPNAMRSNATLLEPASLMPASQMTTPELPPGSPIPATDGRTPLD